MKEICLHTILYYIILISHKWTNLLLLWVIIFVCWELDDFERSNNSRDEAKERYDNSLKGRSENTHSDPHRVGNLIRKDRTYYLWKIEQFGLDCVYEPYEDYAEVVERHYSESGRVYLADFFPNICKTDGLRRDKGWRDRDIEVYSNIIHLGSNEPIGDGSDMEFLSRDPYKQYPNTIRSILLPSILPELNARQLISGFGLSRDSGGNSANYWKTSVRQEGIPRDPGVA